MKFIVITGVTSGFGVNWLYQLDQSERALFFVLARDESKFKQLLSSRQFVNKLQFIQCDLASFESIARATAEIKKQTAVIDVLINNAGVWSEDNAPTSEDGIELTLAVNHLAPYLLTGRLLGLLHNSRQGRIINTASFRHGDARIDSDDIELKKNFSAELAYCNSKLYTILFTRKLAALLAPSGITVNCFDPWIVDTPMLRQAFPRKLLFLYPLVRRYLARTPDRAAQTGLFLVNSPELKARTGGYFKDFKIKRGNRLSRDAELADWLWAESERLTGFSIE